MREKGVLNTGRLRIDMNNDLVWYNGKLIGTLESFNQKMKAMFPGIYKKNKIKSYIRKTDDDLEVLQHTDWVGFISDLKNDPYVDSDKLEGLTR